VGVSLTRYVYLTDNLCLAFLCVPSEMSALQNCRHDLPQQVR
jgi:hypothetical protein